MRTDERVGAGSLPAKHTCIGAWWRAETCARSPASREAGGLCVPRNPAGLNLSFMLAAAWRKRAGEVR
jgi:hypothetical protein